MTNVGQKLILAITRTGDTLMSWPLWGKVVAGMVILAAIGAILEAWAKT